MNKNTSMSSIFNFFQDLLTNKIQVEKGPLEQIGDSNREIDQINKKNHEDLFPSSEEEKFFKVNTDCNLIQSNMGLMSNPYDSIFSENTIHENPVQEKLSPYLSTNNKANSYPEMNTIYPTFSIGDQIKKMDNEFFNNHSIEDNKTRKNNHNTKEIINNNKQHMSKEGLNSEDLNEIPEICRFNREKSEELLCKEEVKFVLDEHEILGYVYLTNYRVVLKLDRPRNDIIRKYLNHLPKDFFDIPLFFINRLEKFYDKKSSSKYVIEIGTKDQRNIKFLIFNEEKLFYNYLNKLINPKDFTDILKYAIRYRETHPVNNDGWKIYKMRHEFKRQGVVYENYVHETNITPEPTKFRLTELNLNFELCQTYPRKLIVPKDITDEDLKLASSFRTKNRIPTLCWYDKEKKSSLWRSSQTKSGITQQRNLYDEKLLKSIADTSNGKITIFDARPYLNALANRFKGAGFENTDNYINSEIYFCEIDNIHSVRNSYQKLLTLCNNKFIHENKKYLSLLEQTSWIDFNHQIMKFSIEIVASLKKGNSVLIHCSDGWDRSSQLTSFTQLLIDPYYRTLKGFLVLIEKEWLSFGHQFGYRNGFYTKELSQDERSPIFLQWLDCVSQLLYQFPNLFEFNNQLLLFIAYHINSGKYGSFLFNSEYERKSKLYNAKNMTVSIWTDILECVHNSNDENIPIIAENLNEDNKFNFINPFYDEKTNFLNKTIFPNFGFHKIRLWEEYFFRYIIFPEFGKFNIENLILDNNSKRIEKKDNHANYSLKKNKSLKNTLDMLQHTKKKITNNVFFEWNKRNDNNQSKEKDKEIESLREAIRDICDNINFSIEDFPVLSDKTKNTLITVSNSLPFQNEGYYRFKPNKND